jgi:hypothetical protein
MYVSAYAFKIIIASNDAKAPTFCNLNYAFKNVITLNDAKDLTFPI